MTTRELKAGKLVIRFHWMVALAVLLAVSGLVRLGFWQLARAGEKSDQQQAFLVSAQAVATPITAVPVAGIAFDALQHQNRRVLLQGEYLNERNIFLIYQTFADQIGYEVLTPFLLDDGHQIVLVSRGWSGIGTTTELLQALTPLTGPHTVEGQLFIPAAAQAAQTNVSQNTDWPLLRRYVNIGELQALFEQELFPYVVRLAAGQEGTLVRHWPAATVASGRHFSYALQWFAMAIGLLAVTLILSSNIRQLLKAPPA